MAKKKTAPRRVPRSGTPRTYSDGAPSQAAPVATAEAAADVNSGATTPAAVAPVRAVSPVRRGSAVGTSGLSRSQVPLSQEYSYVPSDLRRLGIIAVATFAIMIVLGILI
jgi:hypothetical protein